MKNKKKLIISLVITLAVGILTIIGSFALWTKQIGNNINVALNTVDLNKYIDYTSGKAIFAGDLEITNVYSGGTSTTFQIGTKNNPPYPFYATLNLKINDISDILTQSSVLKWTVTSKASGTNNSETVVAYGSFNGTKKGQTIQLLPSIEVTSTKTDYIVYLWVDSTSTNSSLVEGGKIDSELWMDVYQYRSPYNETPPNAPELVDGLIPVKLSDSGDTVTAISEDNPLWYNYSQKKWANAVLVSSINRSNYQNLTGNTEVNIPTSDILAYYVWIPRYNYAIPEATPVYYCPELIGAIGTTITSFDDFVNIDYETCLTLTPTALEELYDMMLDEGYDVEDAIQEYYDEYEAYNLAHMYYEELSGGMDLFNRHLQNGDIILRENNNPEREISIKFENGTPTKSTGTAVGTSYYTHPAFTFGTKELSGIWVGKFETSHTTLSSSTNNNNLGCSQSSCTTYNGLRILPNVVALRYNNISNFFYASRFMESSGNPFGLVASSVDTHMMKNSEWGAVAYLSHSKYGINTEVRINNQNTYTTGCGALTENAAGNATCSNQYGSISTGIYPQSTTGNVTGVFDMVGGAVEYVMGHFGATTVYGNNSGFSATYPLPDSKYYDNYSSSQFDGTYTTNFIKCTLGTCGGHALNETKNWYSYSANFVYSSAPWFNRGGHYNNGSSVGIFTSRSGSGGSGNGLSFRLVLLEE